MNKSKLENREYLTSENKALYRKCKSVQRKYLLCYYKSVCFNPTPASD